MKDLRSSLLSLLALAACAGPERVPHQPVQGVDTERTEVRNPNDPPPQQPTPTEKPKGAGGGAMAAAGAAASGAVAGGGTAAASDGMTFGPASVAPAFDHE